MTKDVFLRLLPLFTCRLYNNIDGKSNGSFTMPFVFRSTEEAKKQYKDAAPDGFHPGDILYAGFWDPIDGYVYSVKDFNVAQRRYKASPGFEILDSLNKSISEEV